MMGDEEEQEFTSLEYLQGLQDGLLLGKDTVKSWIRDKKDPEQLYLMFVYFMERLEEKRVVLVEASLGSS